MPSATITTILKMLESLPEDKQERVAEHLRYYIADLEDEIRWDKLFKETEGELSALAKEIKQKASTGEIEDFDYNRL